MPVRRNSAIINVCHIETDEEDAQSIRLDFKGIMDYFHEHQAHITYLMQPCAMNIATGEQAILAYVMPKYKLWKAADKKMDMEAMMKLALAKTQAEVESAMASPDTGVYDLIRHIELRQQCTIVYLTNQKIARDTHRHYIEGGGFSEHSIFIQDFSPSDSKTRWRSQKNEGETKDDS